MRNVIRSIAAFSLLIGYAGTITAGVIIIPTFTQPMVTIDFDSFSTGDTSLGDIQSSAPAAGITSLSLNCTGGTGSYSVYSAGGNGLACNSTGGLAVYPVLQNYSDMDSFTIMLDHLITEIGFQHGDRTGLGNSINLFSGGSLVETFSAPNFNDNLLMLRSDTPFDRFTFIEPRNWLVTSLVIQTAGESESVPAPATLALFGLGLAGLGYSRRKKA